MFFAPVCTTSSRLLTASLMPSAVDWSSFQFFSRNSRTVLDERPIALACPHRQLVPWTSRQGREERQTFQEEKIPEGSVMYSLGAGSSWSKPTMRVEIPNGRTPPLWVYFCDITRQLQFVDRSSSGLAGRRTDLLDGGDVARDVFDRDGVLDRKTVRLALDSCAVDQDASVRGEPREAQADVIVQHRRFPHRARVLQLQHRLLLHREDHGRARAHPDRRRPLADRLERVIDLALLAHRRARGRRTWNSRPSGAKTVSARS